MPSHMRVVDVDLQEAVLLADLYEIQCDLDAAERYCEQVLELGRLTNRDYFIEEGLMIAAIVKYGRCFTDSVRLSLKLEDLSELDAARKEAHEYYLALRHKSVAHAVNAFEETYVTVSATNRDGDLLPINSVHPGQHRMLLTAESASALLELIRGVRSIINEKVAAEEERLLAFLQTLPLEAIHAGDLHRGLEVRREDVHRRRARGVHASKRTRS